MPDTIPTARDLPNKPLIEAIFELRWALKKSGPMAADPGFQLFQGRYYERVRDDYPFAVNLPASEVPEHLTAHTVRLQFRPAEDQWPVTQVGPGILTVNDTAGYRWESFLPCLKKAISALYQAYPTNLSELKPTQASLRYINVLDFDPEKSEVPVLAYLRDSLHTTIVPEPLLFNGSKGAGSPKGLTLNLMYELEEPKALAGINMTIGQANTKPALIFEIVVHTAPGSAPQSEEAFEDWLTAAHRIVDKWFFALVRGQLLEGFEKNNAN